MFVALATALMLLLDLGVFVMPAAFTRVEESVLCHRYYAATQPGRFGPAPVPWPFRPSRGAQKPGDGSTKTDRQSGGGGDDRDDHSDSGGGGFGNSAGNGTTGNISDYYDDIPEHLCKIAPVQSELATLVGFEASFNSIPGILLTVPLGRLADRQRYGRRPFFFLGMAGMTLYVYWMMFVCLITSLSPRVPMRILWAGSVFQCVGGGAGTAGAMLTTMIADVMGSDENDEEEEYDDETSDFDGDDANASTATTTTTTAATSSSSAAANRATALFCVQLAFYAGLIIGPPIGSAAIVRTGPWAALVLGAIILGIATPALLLIPETIQLRHSGSGNGAGGGLEANQQVDIDEEEAKHGRGLLAHLRSAMAFVVADRRLALVVLGLFIESFTMKHVEILLLYVSRRYGQPIARANFVLTLYSTTNVLVLAAVLPILSAALTRVRPPRPTYTHPHPSLPRRWRWGWDWHRWWRLPRLPQLPTLSANAKDLVLSKASVSTAVAGATAIGASPTLSVFVAAIALFASGSAGWRAVNLSLAAAFVARHQAARLYSIVATLSMVGIFVSGPLLAGLYRVGLAWGGEWVGLPYFFVGGAFAAAGVCTAFIKLDERDVGGADSVPRASGREESVREETMGTENDPLLGRA